MSLPVGRTITNLKKVNWKFAEGTNNRKDNIVLVRCLEKVSNRKKKLQTATVRESTPVNSRYLGEPIHESVYELHEMKTFLFFRPSPVLVSKL